MPSFAQKHLKNERLIAYIEIVLGCLIGVVAQQAGVKAAFTAYDVIGFGRLPHQPLLGRLSADDERIVLEAARRLEQAILDLQTALTEPRKAAS